MWINMSISQIRDDYFDLKVFSKYDDVISVSSSGKMSDHISVVADLNIAAKHSSTVPKPSKSGSSFF